MANLAALRAAVFFSLSTKNLRGRITTPGRAQVKSAAVAAFPVNSYFRQKSAEHGVTLTSFVADL